MKAFLTLLPVVCVCSLAGAPALVQAGSQAAAPLYMAGIRYDLPAVLIPAADIERTKKEMLANKATDVPIRTVDCGGGEGGHQLGVSLVLRQKGQNTAGVAHDQVSEVYHVLEGGGTMILGGKLIEPERRPDSGGNGPGIAGKGIEGGVRTHISKGDVLIIPAGTPHRFESADAFTLYTVVRADPQKVAPLK